MSQYLQNRMEVDTTDAGKSIEGVIVGSDQCSYDDVLEVIEASTTSGILYGKWKDFARRLNVPEGTKTTLEGNIGRPGYTYPDAILTILKDWCPKQQMEEQQMEQQQQKQKQEKAEGDEEPKKLLTDLNSALRKCNLTDIADDLKDKFSTLR